MTFINTYKPPILDDQVDISTKDTYDINSSIPVPPLLETPRVALVPFIPSIHAETIHNAMIAEPAMTKFLPFDWPTLRDFLVFIEMYLRRDPASALFTIIDKTKSPDQFVHPTIVGQIAGMIGWIHGSPQNLSLEMGPVMVLPEFQRTHVSANAIGLLLKYMLDLPAEGGLGFRRVAWAASPLNDASIKAAEKMGFKQEGLLRWYWVLQEGKKAKDMAGVEGRGHRDGRDSVLLSLCWDDWVQGTRDLVLQRMEQY